MNPESSTTNLEELLARALEPIRAEVRALREEVASLRAELGGNHSTATNPVAPLQPSDTAAPVVAAPPTAVPQQAETAPEQPVAPPLDVPLAAPIPPERSDFARMLQRGLAQEAVEHPAESSDSEGPDRRKRGWNPFKR